MSTGARVGYLDGEPFIAAMEEAQDAGRLDFVAAKTATLSVGLIGCDRKSFPSDVADGAACSAGSLEV